MQRTNKPTSHCFVTKRGRRAINSNQNHDNAMPLQLRIYYATTSPRSQLVSSSWITPTCTAHDKVPTYTLNYTIKAIEVTCYTRLCDEAYESETTAPAPHQRTLRYIVNIKGNEESQSDTKRSFWALSSLLSSPHIQKPS